MDMIFCLLFLVGGWFVGGYVTGVTIILVSVVWLIISILWIKSQGLEELSGAFFWFFMGNGWALLMGATVRFFYLNWNNIGPWAQPIIDIFIRR